MKSPYKYNKSILPLFAIFGAVLCIFLYKILPLIEGEPHNKDSIVCLVLLFGLFLIYGLIITVTLASKYNRKVACGVEVSDLVVGNRYFLNGETEATFLGRDEYTGKLRFHIYLVNDSDDANDATLVLPGLVKEYFSSIQEVTSK